MTEIKNHDVVKVKTTGKISRIIDISYAFNRYQIKDVSGWQYGIKDLEKLNTDSLITTIESQKEEIELLKRALKWYGDTDNHDNGYTRYDDDGLIKGVETFVEEDYGQIARNALSEIERLST